MLQVSEKDQLADFAQALRTKLAFFDELEAVGGRFHGSSAPSVDSDSFLPLLSRLDDSLAFVAAHPQCVSADSVKTQCVPNGQMEQQAAQLMPAFLLLLAHLAVQT